MATRQYIGARYVTKIYVNSLDPSSAEWEASTNYEPLTMVTYNNGSYLSRKEVPASVGNPASNPQYWAQTGFYNGQIAVLNAEVAALQEYNDNIDIINVKNFGAVGDGVTDDTMAFSDAINAVTGNHQILYIPAGVYNITNITLHNKYFITFLGVGRKTRLVKNGSGPMFNITGDSSHITFKNMWIHGNNTGNGIYVEGGDSANDRKSTLQFINMFFYDCVDYCVNFSAASGYDLFKSCTFETNIDGCIAIILGRDFNNTALEGVCCNYVSIVDCVFQNPKASPLINSDSRAILFNNCRVVDIRGCDFTHYITAVELTTSETNHHISNIKIHDNKFWNNTLSITLDRNASAEFRDIEINYNTVFFNSVNEKFIYENSANSIYGLYITDNSFLGNDAISVADIQVSDYEFLGNHAEITWTKLYLKIAQTTLKKVDGLEFSAYDNTEPGNTDTIVVDLNKSWKQPINYVALVTNLIGAKSENVNIDFAGSNANANGTLSVTNNHSSTNYYYYLIK